MKRVQYKETQWIIPQNIVRENGTKTLLYGTRKYFVTEDGQFFIEFWNADGILVKTKPINIYTKGGTPTNPYQCLPTQEYVHRVLAEAFIPNPENKRTVNHIDGNRLNNQLSNLEWATYSENMIHAHKLKRERNNNK
jgi:hypothetical protein